MFEVFQICAAEMTSEGCEMEIDVVEPIRFELFEEEGPYRTSLGTTEAL